MAVQAQYPANAFRNKNNLLQEFQLGSCNHNHNNYASQQFFNGATVFSGPESELTCNMSASRKRTRYDPTHPLQMQNHDPHFQFDRMNTEASPISTSLQNLSYQDSLRLRIFESNATSTSGRSSYLLHQDLTSQLYRHDVEIDALVRLQNEKLRSILEETAKRHWRSLVSVLEQQVCKRLREKETELDNANRKNAELEVKVRQMMVENQIWFNIARNNEVIVSTLRSGLEQILLQSNTDQHEVAKEGMGDSDEIVGVVADDAVSCCYEVMVEEERVSVAAEKDIKENRELKSRTRCKVCREKEVSVLLLPCRHLCVCKVCESRLSICPVCNSIKNATLQIVMS
ncbi:PREDICTED: probable BOI-related E3 ubiquitin-protein ligase 3 isoform X2 [Nelumbo nucifera]|uniref:Probable BOI-related E3 ubiquitin-protein ligase 3 isoform X2 n=1 Tax=Nelumbo nucifera TaxID=4432 RepID=A0A1U7Z9X3_NELNU|nr:PREDICTED: probable BOI-related E3 ubiquitin-protein ligase 3 isoform X2 [Nelumbo nucifera]